LVTLILAWAGVRVWDRSQRPVLRWALLTLLAVLLLDGGSRIMHRRAPAAQTSPYLQLEQRIAEHIPDGSRVLGPNLHWLGLRQYPYRSWAGVALMIGGRSYHEDVSLAAAVERANPDIILIDRGMASYFDARADPGHPDHGDFLSFQAFIDQRGVEHVATVEDSSYGAVRILRVSRSP
jgi:hypothetical protein